MSFGENLQYYRAREGLTQEELAERLEVSRQSGNPTPASPRWRS